MLNKVVLIGRLTRDPELRYTTSGVAVCTFTLAVDRGFVANDGEQQADFIPIVTWRKIAEACGKYISKGGLVAVAGRIQVRQYEAQDGSKRYVTEVVGDEVRFLARSSNDQSQSSNTASNQRPAANEPHNIEGFHPVDDTKEISPDADDLPF